MGNPFVHIDLSTSNPDAAKKFYSSIFNWKFQDFPQMNWSGIDVGDGVGGGLGGKQDPAAPTSWTAYVAVDDVKKTIAKAEAAGATVVVPYMEIPGMGWLGVFTDPQGASVGVWQAMTPPKVAAKAPAKKAMAKKAPAKKAPAKKVAAKKVVAAKKAPAKKKAGKKK